MACLIWGGNATEEPRLGQSSTIDSSRAGGKYRITGSVSAAAGSLPIEKKLLLTTWLCNQRRLGVTVPEITSYNLEEITSGTRLSFSRRVDRALLFIAQEAPRVDHWFGLGNLHTLARFLAETEGEDSKEAYALVEIMYQMSLLRDKDEKQQYRVSPGGWKRLDELTTQATDSTQGFVAMWFNDEVEPAWNDGIRPAIEKAGYKAVRIDKVEHNDKVDDRIIAEIRRSRFLVADFSCEKNNVRGGVYYEAGFAEGINIPIIWTCRQESMDDLHFDTRQYNHIVWTSPPDLKEKLTNRILAVLGEGPLKSMM